MLENNIEVLVTKDEYKKINEADYIECYVIYDSKKEKVILVKLNKIKTNKNRKILDKRK